MAGAGSEQQRENYFWPLLSLVLVILPQVVVPPSMRLGPPVGVPLVEGAAALVLLGIAAKRGPVPRSARPLILSLLAVLAVANTVAAGRLIYVVLTGRQEYGEAPTAGRLLVTATTVLAANVVTFGLIYWQLDRGGPDRAEHEREPLPDFLFPQMGNREFASPGWRPRYPDHLYVSFTNILAFSPTDTLPLKVRVKALMALQSMVAVSVSVVVVARVINILPTSS